MENERTTPVDVKELQDPVVESDDKMEIEEVLSGSESVEMSEDTTESSSKITSSDDKASEPSSRPSESTSSIEVKSEPPKSPESTPVTAASKDPETAAATEVPEECAKTAATEVPEAGATAAATEVTEECAGATAAATEVTEECTGATAEATEVPEDCAGATAVASPTRAVPAECSPPPKQSIMDTIIKYLSPTKKTHSKSPKEKSGRKSKSRSKSMSPPDKSVVCSPKKDQKDLAEQSAGEAADEKEETFKKGSEKKGVMKTVKAAFAKIIPKSKSSSTESATLVTNEEGVEKAASAPKPKEKKKSTDDVEGPGKSLWTADRRSLNERPSISMTVMTDISSGSEASGIDTFLRRPSEPESTSVEVACSQPSSPEQMPDIQSDKEAPADESTEKAHVEAEDVEMLEVKEDVKESQDSEMRSGGDEQEKQGDEQPKTE